jgi:hypothetical protein
VRTRYAVVCNVLLLLYTSVAYGGGIFQRTRNGETLVWNNLPRPTDQATWSGKRDADGYATGYGTLTWYRAERTIVTGSNIPVPGRAILLGRYTGKMVRGKFQGLVVNVDPNGKIFHGTYVKGRKSRDWSVGPPQAHHQRLALPSSTPQAEPPAEGPRPTPQPQPPPAAVSPTPTVLSTPPPPSLTATAAYPTVKDHIIEDFKAQTQSILSRVGDATDNFREVDRLASVRQLPAPVSESVSLLMDKAREVRSKLGYETVLQTCLVEAQTVDALSVLDQVTRNVAEKDASQANSKLSDFLEASSVPVNDDQKPLWNYLASLQLLLSHLENQANVHLRRAESLDLANKTGQAIREYQSAYQIFPSPATAEKIRHLQDNSLGL